MQVLTRNGVDMPAYEVVERRERIAADEFAAEYVKQGRPLIITGALDSCSALSRWTLDYLRAKAGQQAIGLKAWYASDIQTIRKSLDSYIDSLEAYEARLKTGSATSEERPPYLHDVPLISVLPDAKSDLEGFPLGYFPAWYGDNWWKFAQFFLGPSHSLTPLHFDCLLTHNLFCQIKGRKRFVLMPHDQLKYCYPYQWRWCAVDVEEPDYERYPLYRRAKPIEVLVGPGDVLYMPPGTLHHARSLDCAISFNVDWHTRDSALKGALSFVRGMPLKNVYYNCVIALGLWTGISVKRVLPFFRSYLNYVS